MKSKEAATQADQLKDKASAIKDEAAKQADAITNDAKAKAAAIRMTPANKASSWWIRPRPSKTTPSTALTI